MFNVKTRIAEDLELTCDFEQSATGLLRKTGKLSGISMSVHGGGGVITCMYGCQRKHVSVLSLVM